MLCKAVGTVIEQSTCMCHIISKSKLQVMCKPLFKVKSAVALVTYRFPTCLIICLTQKAITLVYHKPLLYRHV